MQRRKKVKEMEAGHKDVTVIVISATFQKYRLYT